MDDDKKPTHSPKQLSEYERGYLDGLRDGKSEAEKHHANKQARDIARLREEIEQYDKDKRAKD